MKLRVFIEPQQGASYSQQLKVAQKAEELGFDAFFRSDHYLRMGDGSPYPGPSDSWVTLGAIARETSTIRLGTLLTSATFRAPGVLAISVAQVDEMSNGRIELGLGAGWFEAEHRAYGIEFPDTSERFDRLKEQLEIITGLWKTKIGDGFSYDGKYYKLENSPALPKPVSDPHPPIIIGGRGPKKTPALAGAFAQEYNVPFASIEKCKEQFELVSVAAESSGRSPSGIINSVALVACLGNDSETLTRRASSIGRSIDDLTENGLCGSAEQIVEKISRYQEIGAQRVYLQILDLDDLDHLRDISDGVKSQFS
ncbi:MAG: LLM class F420-dependent oxidoreductase [Actinomycetota bacterium]|nr:LLM class F420-dependent oxidoreductase [Actinomycetota bacterium]